MIPALLMICVVASCAAGDNAATGGPPRMTAVGMPVYIALKVPFCVATVAIAAPLAGISGFAPTYQSVELRQGLNEGIAQNCGF